ncbi:MAG: DUF4411 family protein [bacterium]
MLYLLDANVLIDANRDYYPIGRVDEYWEWLIFQGQQGRVKVPIEVYEEIKEGKQDALALWAREAETEEALKLDEDVDIDLVRRVSDEGYAPDLTDVEVEKIGRDPFLIAYALIDVEQRVVVTTETSQPRKERANRKVPDVCRQFRVTSINAYQFGHQLDFRTDWKR